MKTKYLPLPASVFMKEKKLTNTYVANFNAYKQQHSNLFEADFLQDALDFINKKSRTTPWVIVKYDPSNKFIPIVDIYCLKKSDYKNPPFDVGSFNARWILFGPEKKLNWPRKKLHVERDMFLQAAGELRCTNDFILNAIKDLKKAFPKDDVIAKKTYHLSCKLSDNSINSEQKLQILNDYREECLALIPSWEEIALKAFGVFLIAALVTVLTFMAFSLGVYLAAPVAAGLCFVGVMAFMLQITASSLGLAAVITSSISGLVGGSIAAYCFFGKSAQEKSINNLVDICSENLQS